MKLKLKKDQLKLSQFIEMSKEGPTYWHIPDEIEVELSDEQITHVVSEHLSSVKLRIEDCQHEWIKFGLGYYCRKCDERDII